MYESVDNFYLKFPSSVLVVGPSCSGKTTLVAKALSNWSTCICPSRPKLKRLIIYYETWQKLYKEIRDEIVPEQCEVFFFQEPPNEKNLSVLGPLNEDEAQVVIVDDLQSKLGHKDNCIEKLFTIISHHCCNGAGAQCWLLAQDLQAGGDSMRTIRKNAIYTFLTPGIMNGNALETLQRSLFYRYPGYLQAVAVHAFLQRHCDYILIDNSATSIRCDKFRLRCGLFNDEAEKLVFNPK